MSRKPYLYQHHAWPEMAEVVKKQPVVVLPIGSVEDHGPHLPLDTDNFQIWSFCEEAAKRADGGILRMPLVPWIRDSSPGFSPARATEPPFHWGGIGTAFNGIGRQIQTGWW